MPWQAMHSRLALPGGKRAGMAGQWLTTEEILADYEDLEREDILAVLSYAARLAHIKRLESLAA